MIPTLLGYFRVYPRSSAQIQRRVSPSLWLPIPRRRRFHQKKESYFGRRLTGLKREPNFCAVRLRHHKRRISAVLPYSALTLLDISVVELPPLDNLLF